MQRILLMHSGTKDQIIEVLSSRFPLSAKRIYNELKKRYLSSVTYHACYMHVQELVKQGVLVKEGVEYRINNSWITKIKGFVENIETNYSDLNVKLENFNLVTLKNQIDFYNFIADFREAEIEKMKEEGEIIWIGNHTWGPILFMSSVTKNLSHIISKKLKLYLCIRGSTKLDKVITDFYKGLGFENVKCGVDDYQNFSIYIFENTALLALHDSNIIEKMNDLFKKANNFKDFDLSNIYETIFRANSPVHVFIIKNANFIRKYKTYSKSFF